MHQLLGGDILRPMDPANNAKVMSVTVSTTSWGLPERSDPSQALTRDPQLNQKVWSSQIIIDKSC